MVNDKLDASNSLLPSTSSHLLFMYRENLIRILYRKRTRVLNKKKHAEATLRSTVECYSFVAKS